MTDPATGTTARLVVDLSAIAANYRRLGAELGAGVVCAGVLKANGYGLGANRIGRALWDEGCRVFFVAHFEEGRTLREALPGAEIFVLNGAAPKDEAEFAAHRLAPTLNSLADVTAWARLCARLGPHPAALHIDTGMSRLGLPPEELDILAAEPARLGAIDLRLVMSHLACGEERGHPMNARQLAAFEEARARLPAARASLANSSGIFLGPRYHFGLVRPGLALYGGNPFPDQPNPMRPTVRIEARLLQVRNVDQGGTVGYGAARILERRTKIATIAIGYADGYRRNLGDRDRVLVAGQSVPVIGRVSMDLVTLDVTGLADGALVPGSWVEIVGPNRTVEDLAAQSGTIDYEILTTLGARLQRHYVTGAA